MEFTIITAVFNRRETIRHALESLGAQSHTHFKHVIVDGASTDGTLEVVRAHAGQHTSILSEPDRGIYDALNKGLTLASGDVVGVLHSDDVLAHAGVLASVADAFERDDVQAVYGDLQYVRENDTSSVIRHWRSGEFHHRNLRYGWMPPHPALFLRRSLIERLGGYDTSFRIAGDYDAILRYFTSDGFRATYIPEVLVRMRTGGESNGSLGRIIQKSREDYTAIRRNGVGGLHTLALKNLRKIRQFL